MTSTPRTASAQPAPPIGDGPVQGLPTPARPRRRPLLVLVGVLAAALAATLVAVVLNSASETTLVWATATPVTRGQPVLEAQLQPVEVPVGVAEGLVAATGESQTALTSGPVWAADLPTGQLLSDALTLQRLPTESGQAMVGLRLDPGGFPTVGLHPGDAVQVIGVAGDGEATVLVDRAIVESVVELGEAAPSTPRLVTVQVPEPRAAAVAAAGMAGQVSLVVVP